MKEKQRVEAILDGEVTIIDMSPKTNIFLIKCNWEECNSSIQNQQPTSSTDNNKRDAHEIEISHESTHSTPPESTSSQYSRIKINKKAKYILIDTGTNGQEEKLIKVLDKELGITPNDLSLIVITHAHMDHAGTCWYLKKHFPHVPIAVPDLEYEMLRRGEPAPSTPTNLVAKILYIRGSRKKILPFEPDLRFKGGEHLEEFGVKASIVHMKGHTEGNIAVMLDNKKAAIMNDVMKGGFFSYGKPGYHLFYDDKMQILKNIKWAFDEGFQTFLVTHGYAFTREPLITWLEKELKQNKLM